MRFGRMFTGILVLLAAGFARGQGTPATTAPTAEFRDGHWQNVPGAGATTAPATDATLDDAQRLLASKDPAAAETVGLYWIKTHASKSPGRDRAIFLIAQAKFGVDNGDDRFYAFYYCDELLDEYPESRYFQAALELQYKIADAYLSGKNRTFLGLPVLGCGDEAVEMLYRIQLRTPGSPMAERCLLRTADFYFAQGEYELAHDAYGYFIKAFPRGDKVPQAKFRQACASLAQFRGVQFDPTNLYNAKTELTDFAMAYPKLAARENVDGIIVRIDQALAQKLFITAQFYERTHAWHGAAYTYRYLLLTYPNAADAPAARRALAGLPKSALSDPEPHPGAGFVLPVDPVEPGAAK